MAAATVDFNGTWDLETSSPNFEELLTAMGIGFVMRKAIINLRPEITIKQDGDDFHIITKTPIKTRETKFKVGEEFKEKHPLKDEENTLLVTWEGDKLVQKVLDKEDSPVATRSLQDDGKMMFKQKKGDLEVFRIFTKKE